VICYRYNQQTAPPAPFVYATFQNPADSTELRDVPAQIDTAADRTVLPDHVVAALGLAQIGRIAVGGLGGVIQYLPTYAVRVAIHQFPSQTVKVVASSGEPWVLLGRDVLNAHRLFLDGPQLTLEIGLA
jgi:predicted aspartyl protease